MIESVSVAQPDQPAVKVGTPKSNSGDNLFHRQLPFAHKLRSRLPQVRARQAIWKLLTQRSQRQAQQSQEGERVLALGRQTHRGVQTMDAVLAKTLTRLGRLESDCARLRRQQAATLEGVAALLSDHGPAAKPSNSQSQGLEVFSRFDEDGIIQALVEQIDVPNRTFIEFTVTNYPESNSCFLMRLPDAP